MKENQSDKPDDKKESDVEGFLDAYSNWVGRLTPAQVKDISECEPSLRDSQREFYTEINRVKYLREQEDRRKQLEESNITFNEVQIEFIRVQAESIKIQAGFLDKQLNLLLKQEEYARTIKWSTIVMTIATVFIAIGTMVPLVCSKTTNSPTNNQQVSQHSQPQLRQSPAPTQLQATKDSLIRK